MLVTCPKCGKHYDDTYRWTYCPHDKFKMRAVCGQINPRTGQYEEIVAENLPQVDTFFKGDQEKN